MPKMISLHAVLEPLKQALLASRDVIISSQICGSKLQKVVTDVGCPFLRFYSYLCLSMRKFWRFQARSSGNRAIRYSVPLRSGVIVPGPLNGAASDVGRFPDLDLSFVFCPFWNFPDLSGIFPVFWGGLSRLVLSSFSAS